MATEKNISSRIIHKHDIGANWNKATNFIPKAGEIIVYDKDETYDYERFKIGDGETVVVNLPFAIVQPDWNQNDENAPDYVKNKPFGEFDNTMNIGVAPGGQSMAPIPANTEFTASCNGTTKTFNTSSLSNPKSFVGGMSIVYSRGMVVVINQNPQARYTVTLRYNVVQQLDEQYIPDTIARLTDIPVTSVNGKTGAVSLTATDVGATNVSGSTTNGNILIDSTETNVYSHPNSGVAAGTYKSVTVNAQGHVTTGSNPTTLDEYGITDAESKSDASTKLEEAKAYADTAVETAIADKAEKEHTHDDIYYTEAEVDEKISAINTSIDRKYKAINKKISNLSKTITEQDIDTAFNDIFGGE